MVDTASTLNFGPQWLHKQFAPDQANGAGGGGGVGGGMGGVPAGFGGGGGGNWGQNRGEMFGHVTGPILLLFSLFALLCSDLI
jgi:hypothetical protein